MLRASSFNGYVIEQVLKPPKGEPCGKPCFTVRRTYAGKPFAWADTSTGAAAIALGDAYLQACRHGDQAAIAKAEDEVRAFIKTTP